MGEYATYEGSEIKIGTCEDMLYLRWDQAHLVEAQRNSVDPCGRGRDQLRFRFPFPDEDRIEPGMFADPFRGLEMRGVRFGAKHCAGDDGTASLVQQRWHDGLLVAVCRCSSCDGSYRMETLDDAQAVIDALHAMADEAGAGERRAVFLRSVADRVAAGYEQKAA